MMHRDRSRQMAAAFVAASLAACAEKAVDVGHNAASSASSSADAATPARTPPVYATAAPSGDAGIPFAIVQNESQIPAFAASAGRVFWLSVDYEVPPGKPIPTTNSMYLRSCKTADCAGTLWSISVLDVHDGGTTLVPNWIYVNDTRVFWPNVDEGRGTLFCARENPDDRGSLGVAVGPPFAADDDRAYLMGTVMCDIADCAATESRPEYATPVGPTPFTGGGNIVVDGDYLYMSDGDILRARKDGTGTIQVIAKDQQNVYALAVHGGQVYWVERAALGRVYSCPVDGCDGDPAVVLADLKFPNALAVDDGNVYVVVQSDGEGLLGFGSKIVSCSLTDCTAPTVVVPAGASAAVFVDSDYVYYNGISCDAGVCHGYIAAVGK